MARASSTRPAKRAPFARQLPRPVKRRAGSTGVERTPLAIRTTGISVDADLRAYVRERLGKRLAKFASRIERVTVRFEDLNGPKGGVDVVCRIKVVMGGIASVVVEQSGGDLQEAFDLAADRTERAVRRALGKKGLSAKPIARGKTSEGARRKRVKPSSSKRRPLPPPEEGSLIGRRVGRSEDVVESLVDAPEKRRRDLPVDTSLPGWSATDKRAGGGSTAMRNVKLRTSRATAALEDSAKGRPSRKSTRPSANRMKQGDPLHGRQIARTTSSQARAARAAASR